MIFSSLNQVNCFLVFLFFGFIFGFILNLSNEIFFKKIKKNYIKTIFLTIFYGIFAIFFVFLKNFFNFGIFSFAILIAYLLGFLLSKKMIKILVEFFFLKCYNLLNKKNEDDHDKQLKD